MVIKYIIYEQYDINRNAVYLYLYTKICIKKISKLFQKKTEWLPDMSYPLYKKPEIPGQENDILINNR